MGNQVVWFDLPVLDLARAMTFYEVLQDKHQIGPFGFRAIIVDPERNRVALHAETNST